MGLLLISCNRPNIPDEVKNAFNDRFKDVRSVNWQMEEPGEFEAEFKLNGVKTSATFDKDGNWKETEAQIKIQDVPDEISKILEIKYAGYDIRETTMVDTPEYQDAYEIVLSSKDNDLELVFSSGGKILSQKQE